jgi:hypothetical protein
MDLFLMDSDQIPLPPDQVRIRQLSAAPYPDGGRVRVLVEVDAFQKRPSVDLAIVDDQGQELAATSILESVTRRMEVVMHLRRPPAAGRYRLHALLYFVRLQPPESAAGESPVERLDADRAQAEFEIVLGEDREAGRAEP